jgi:hypothetical protein
LFHLKELKQESSKKDHGKILRHYSNKSKNDGKMEFYTERTIVEEKNFFEYQNASFIFKFFSFSITLFYDFFSS